jgi:hypothetical protein
VSRYGEQVVGVPQDPVLRGMALVTPVVVTLLAAIFGVVTFWRWQRLDKPVAEAPPTEPAPNAVDDDGDDYRRRIEQDLG